MPGGSEELWKLTLQYSGALAVFKSAEEPTVKYIKDCAQSPNLNHESTSEKKCSTGSILQLGR